MEHEVVTRILYQHQYFNGVGNLWEVIGDGGQIKTYYHFEYDYVLWDRYKKWMYKMMSEKKMMQLNDLVGKTISSVETSETMDGSDYGLIHIVFEDGGSIDIEPTSYNYGFQHLILKIDEEEI